MNPMLDLIGNFFMWLNEVTPVADGHLIGVAILLFAFLMFLFIILR